MASFRLIMLGVAAVMLSAAPASARHRHHWSVRADAPAKAGPAYYPAVGWEAESIARATARMQAAPGVTNELAPDAKETATGGPVGGVPGFSGGPKSGAAQTTSTAAVK